MSIDEIPHTTDEYIVEDGRNNLSVFSHRVVKFVLLAKVLARIYRKKHVDIVTATRGMF